jgi:DUF1365 family protein
MNSCLYECSVLHARFSPRQHRFLYRIFLFAIDLDELAALHRRLTLFSFGRRNLYSFRDHDFLPTGEPLHPPNPSASPSTCNLLGNQPASLKQRVLAHVATTTPDLDLTDARVVLVTLPRVLGYLFNPVSFYFCYDRTGAPVAALAEVTNTFKEMKPYLLGPETRTDAASASAPSTSDFSSSTGEGRARGATFALRTPKHFYVSPFSDVDVAFDFTLRTPGKNLSIQIDDYVGTERTLTSTLSGPRRELTNARLAWFTLKYPLITLRIIGLIHWHALVLWVKRIPWFAKSARAADQRGLYRPHASITASTSLSSANALSAPQPTDAV